MVKIRLLYKASLVFLLTELGSKVPITDAVILCNGKQLPYTRKREGYYVFSNLYPGEYKVTIRCNGYVPLDMIVTVRENETKIIITDLSYTIGNSKLEFLKRFELNVTEKGNPLANEEVTVILKNDLEFFILKKPIEAESFDCCLNLEMNKAYMAQKYFYIIDPSNAEETKENSENEEDDKETKKDKGKKKSSKEKNSKETDKPSTPAEIKEYSLFVIGYDSDKKCYDLEYSAKEKIETNGKFYPYWVLRTDSKGRIVVPFLKQFMKESEVKFEVRHNEKSVQGAVDTKKNKKDSNKKVFYLQLDF